MDKNHVRIFIAKFANLNSVRYCSCFGFHRNLRDPEALENILISIVLSCTRLGKVRSILRFFKTYSKAKMTNLSYF